MVDITIFTRISPCSWFCFHIKTIKPINFLGGGENASGFTVSQGMDEEQLKEKVEKNKQAVADTWEDANNPQAQKGGK